MASPFYLGALPSPDNGGKDFKASTYIMGETLPYRTRNLFEYEQKFGPRVSRSQGATSECVAHGHTSAKEVFDTWESGAVVNLSPQDLYAYCKAHDGIPDQDGTFPRVASAGLLKVGCCLESDWPFESRWPPLTQPGSLAAIHRPGYRITAYAVTKDLVDIKTFLAIQKRPVTIAMRLYPSFAFAKDRVMLPGPNEEVWGGHELMVWDYDDGRQAVLLENSWGRYWGEAIVESKLRAGFSWLPYEFWTQTNDVLECHTFVDLLNIPQRFSDFKPADAGGDEAWAAQDYVWQRGIMQGTPGGNLEPWEPLYRRHVALMMRRLELLVTDDTLLEDYTPATRGWVADLWPELEFRETDRRDEVLTRFQMMLLAYRRKH